MKYEIDQHWFVQEINYPYFLRMYFRGYVRSSNLIWSACLYIRYGNDEIRTFEQRYVNDSSMIMPLMFTKRKICCVIMIFCLLHSCLCGRDPLMCWYWFCSINWSRTNGWCFSDDISMHLVYVCAWISTSAVEVPSSIIAWHFFRPYITLAIVIYKTTVQ